MRAVFYFAAAKILKKTIRERMRCLIWELRTGCSLWMFSCFLFLRMKMKTVSEIFPMNFRISSW